MVTAVTGREARGWCTRARTHTQRIVSFAVAFRNWTVKRTTARTRQAFAICDACELGHRQECLCYLGNGTDFAGKMAYAFAHVF